MLRFFLVFPHVLIIIIIQIAGNLIGASSTMLTINERENSEKGNGVDCKNWDSGSVQTTGADFNCTVESNISECVKESSSDVSVREKTRPTCALSGSAGSGGEELEEQKNCLNCSKGDNQYLCDPCSRLTDSERITRILEAPASLTLTLKHFRYDPASHQRTKLLQSVTLDEHLTLDYCHYVLYAAVVHCGSSVDSGHYYTLARDKMDWFKFNDAYVSKTTPDNLSSFKPPETPYILFYCREDLSDLENLPTTVLSHRLQTLLSKNNSEYEQAEEYRSVNLF